MFPFPFSQCLTFLLIKHTKTKKRKFYSKTMIERLVIVGLFTVQKILQKAFNTQNLPLSEDSSNNTTSSADSNNNTTSSVSSSVDSVKCIHNGPSKRHKQIIQQLHTGTVSAEKSNKTTNSSSEERCCICIGNYKPGQAICKAITPKCNHIFHQVCLIKWLADNDTCPLCKVDIMNEKSQPQQANPRPPRYPFQPQAKSRPRSSAPRSLDLSQYDERAPWLLSCDTSSARYRYLSQ